MGAGSDAGAFAFTPMPVPLALDMTVVVSAPDVVLRAAPSSGAVVITELPEGMSLTVVGESEQREGVTWWRVEEAETGLIGYVSAEVLRAES